MSTDASFNPEAVALSFLKAFYEKLSQAPPELYRFFTPDASFTHCLSQGEVRVADVQTIIFDFVRHSSN